MREREKNTAFTYEWQDSVRQQMETGLLALSSFRGTLDTGGDVNGT